MSPDRWVKKTTCTVGKRMSEAVQTVCETETAKLAAASLGGITVPVCFARRVLIGSR